MSSKRDLKRKDSWMSDSALEDLGQDHAAEAGVTELAELFKAIKGESPEYQSKAFDLISRERDREYEHRRYGLETGRVTINYLLIIAFLCIILATYMEYRGDPRWAICIYGGSFSSVLVAALRGGHPFRRMKRNRSGRSHSKKSHAEQ
jgi:hypothetical protein